MWYIVFWGWLFLHCIIFLRFIDAVAAAAAKSLQSCPTLCDLIDGSPWGSPIPGILQTRTLEWVAISFPNEGEKWKWSRSVVFDSSWPHGLWPTRLLRPWDFPGKSAGVGCHCLLWPETQMRFIQWTPEERLWNFNLGFYETKVDKNDTYMEVKIFNLVINWIPKMRSITCKG